MKSVSLFKRNWIQERRSPFFLALSLLTTPLVLILFKLILSSSPSRPIGFQIAVLHDAQSHSANMDPRIAGFLNKIQILGNPSLRELENESTYRNKSKSAVAKTIDELDVLLNENLDDWGLVLNKLESNSNQITKIQIITKRSGASDSERLEVEQIIRSIWMESQGIQFEWEGEKKRVIDPFQSFAPRLLVFMTLMVLFSSTMTFAREIESGVLLKYRMAELALPTYLFGMFGYQLFLTTVSLILSTVVFMKMGFPLDLFLCKTILLTWLGALSSFGISLCLVRFVQDSAQGFLISSFCMFVLLLGSGIVFPKPNLIWETDFFGDFNCFWLLPQSLVIDGISNATDPTLGTTFFVKAILLLGLLASCYMVCGALVFRSVFYGKQNKLSFRMFFHD